MRRCNFDFIWNGISSNDMNIVVSELPPISKPEEKVEKITIPGRSGYLTVCDGAYSSYLKSVEFHIIHEKENLDRVKRWLSGSGKVIFGNEPDKFYYARIINQIDLNQVIPILHKAIVIFDCQPFGYLHEGEKTISLTEPTTLFNMGNIDSEPYLKVYAEGDIILRINDESIIIKGIQESVEIDTFLDSFFNSTESLESHVIGNCPVFQEGKNTISWDGNVKKIEIIPRWRCL